MLNFIIKIIISYAICGFLSYLFFKKVNLAFTDKNGNEVKLEEYKVKNIKIAISILWIYFLPALAIDYIKRHEKGD